MPESPAEASGLPETLTSPRATASMARAGGVLLHVTSLPGGHGMGDFGPEAYRFVDWLVKAGQTIWQILPLGPTGWGESPYASSSAFAGNPSLISLQTLVAEGLLQENELTPNVAGAEVQWDEVAAFKQRALLTAYGRFTPTVEYESFCVRAAYWLDDFARIRAGQGSNEGFERFVQFNFERQWAAVKHYANERGVRIMGDVPIFVADGSVDVLAHPELFYLDDRGHPTIVAGVPPDLFSATGQRWGNPLYRWEAMAADGYQWWRNRMRRILEQVDIVRVDHFRGFAAYWAVPASEKTALNGEWRRGPRFELFQAFAAEFGSLPMVIEDLGVITPDVVALREQLGYPGMKVLQFAFDSGPDNPYLPNNYVPNCIVYTGTHDNQTTLGWYRSQPQYVQDNVRKYLARDDSDIAWDFIRLALSSVATLAVVPVQDILRLGDEARLNFPGKAAGNWRWRMAPDSLNDDLAAQLHEMSATYGRVDVPPKGTENLPENYPL